MKLRTLFDVVVGSAIGVAVAFIIGAVLWAAVGPVAGAAPYGGPSPSALEHHSHVRWVMERHHAAELRQAGTLRMRSWLVELWTPVAICEEGGWIGYASAQFPDSIGQDSTNWYRFGGGVDLRPFVQAEEGMRFVDYFHTALPDRGGACAGY